MGVLVLGKLFYKGVPLLFKYYYVWGFIVFILPAIIVSFQAGIEGEDWRLPAIEGGKQILSQDIIIQDYVDNLEFEKPEGKTTEEKIDTYFLFWWETMLAIGEALLKIFFLVLILFKWFLLMQDNTSKTRSALFKAISVMFILQMLVQGIPFRGVFELGKFIIREVIL